MIQLNFQNAEELIFKNEAAQKTLPPYFHSYFETWKLSKRIPSLRQMGKTSILDLLNGLRDEHISALEEFFGERIAVEKLNYNVVTNIKIPVEELEACKCLCEAAVGFSYFSSWRDHRFLYITFWR